MALFMSGMFNNVDPFFGFPLYFWEWIFNIILIIVMWIVLWYVWWKPYTPLHGLYWAWKDMTPAAFICDKNLIAEMVPERQAKCIFDYSQETYEIDVPDHRFLDYVPLFKRLNIWFHNKTFYYPSLYLPNLSKFDAFRYKVGHVNKDVEIAISLQNGEWDRFPSVICGGVPVDIIVDTDNWTLPKSKQHAAIVKSARAWNKDHPTNQVHSYSKYQKYLISGEIPCPAEIKMEFLVPWTRIEIGFPMDLEENDWAGKRRQMARDKARDMEMGDRWRLALIIVIGGLILAGLLLLARFVSFILTHSGG